MIGIKHRRYGDDFETAQLKHQRRRIKTYKAVGNLAVDDDNFLFVHAFSKNRGRKWIRTTVKDIACLHLTTQPSDLN